MLHDIGGEKEQQQAQHLDQRVAAMQETLAVEVEEERHGRQRAVSYQWLALSNREEQELTWSFIQRSIVVSMSQWLIEPMTQWLNKAMIQSFCLSPHGAVLFWLTADRRSLIASLPLTHPTHSSTDRGTTPR